MIPVIVQARMGCTRFPGKVLEPILEKPMIWHILNHVHAVEQIDNIIVAIPESKEDEPLIHFLVEYG